MYPSKVIFLTITVVSVLIRLVSSCDVVSAANCLKTLSNSINITSVVQMLHADALNKLCRQWPSVDDCMKADILDCDDAEKLEFDMVDNVLDYLCGPGQKAYMENIQCLTSAPIAKAVEACTNSLESRLKGAPSMKQICREIVTVKLCFTEGISAHCNQAATDVSVTFLDKVLSPMTKMAKCPTTGQGLSTAAIAGIVTALLAIVAITVGGVITAVRYQRSKNVPYNYMVNTVKA